MKSPTLLIALTILLSFNLGAQSAAGLEAQLDALLASYPQEVLVGKTNFSQEVSYDSSTPYRITISKTKEDGKDNEPAIVEVNLGLITKARDYSHKKNGISVILSSGTTATIKAFEGEEADGYLKETSILAADVNNGREMEEILKQILPLAKEAWEAAAALPTEATELQTFTGNQVSNAVFGEKEYAQIMEFLPGIGNATITTSGSANRDETTTYLLNLADLDAKQVLVKAKGSEIEVSLTTRKKRKFIEIQKEEAKSFTGNFKLIFASFDDAQIFTYALKALIIEAEKAAKKEIVNYTTTDEALKEVSQLLNATEIENVEQKLTTQCNTTHNLQDGEEELTFQFSFADLDEKDISLSPKGAVVYLPLSTRKNQKFIGVRADEEVKNYDDEVEFQFNSIAQAKRAAHAVEYLAENCPSEITAPSMDLVVELINDAERKDGEVTQIGAIDGEENCSMSLTQTESGKKTTESIYEFNLYDLDLKSGKIVIKGTEVNVTFSTDGKEDIIQLVKNNEEQTYTSLITFYTADLTAAKSLLAGMQSAIESCAQ